MPLRYLAALALTWALTASLPAHAGVPRHRHTARRRRAAATAAVSAENLYSRRALRRARIILELKLMELRGERLERVRKALEKHVPIDQLLKEP
ncbi:MAG TPA: hypothetical protein VFN37_00330 [Candidatus Baltobacteraceae bacterium]|nr:hypothetical protein [Candidatus Baltobacteraceae bacterium]